MNNKKHIVILGAGTAGAIVANKLAKVSDVMVTVIDPAEEHYYQPGLLFHAFNNSSLDSIHKPTASVLHGDICYIPQAATGISADEQTITTEDGTVVSYDALIVATGTRIDPTLTDGMSGSGWRKNIFDFYTPDGAEALREALVNFNGGKLVVQITEMPIKCPVAPLEFVFLADSYFKKRGIRDSVQLSLVTPLSGAFTKPVASEKLGHLLTDKQIETVTDFYIEKVVPEENTLYCYDGRTINYDLLVTIPTNVGTPIIQQSDFSDDLGFIEVDPHTLQSIKQPAIFAIGDATNVATSKAGSVAHFEADVVCKNVVSYVLGYSLEESFDGHSNCFVEMGGGKALLLDFNYETQPYEGKFPFAGIGPMSLLKPTRLNHWGKLAFKYIYWYMLIPGHTIPFIPHKMSLKGKKIEQPTQ